MNTWTIKNSLGQTVEPRFACDTTDPDEALRRYLYAAQLPEHVTAAYSGAATLNLTGRIVTWTDPAGTRHFAEVVAEEGTMVRLQFGDKTPLLPRSSVELSHEHLQWISRISDYTWAKEWREAAVR